MSETSSAPPRKSSDNVRKMFGDVHQAFGTILENLRKVVGNLRKVLKNIVYIIKRIMHKLLEIWNLSSRVHIRCLTRLLRSLVRYRCEHSEINSISPRAHVLFSIYITQVILAFWLVLNYDLLEDTCPIDVIITKFFPLCLKLPESFENWDNILHDWAKNKYKKVLSRHKG